MTDFYKYHGLGNDYLVIDPARFDVTLNRESIRLICDRNYGVGSDGILYGPLRAEDGSIRVRIFNPDGSEAEKSGNGLTGDPRERFFSNPWRSTIMGSRSVPCPSATPTVLWFGTRSTGIWPWPSDP